MKLFKRFTLFVLIVFLSVNSYSAVFEPFFPHLIQMEGVYFVMVQYDRGGATKYGVTLVVYDRWCNKKRIVWVICDKDHNGIIDANDLRLTTLNDMKPIYQQQYWDAYRLSEINNQAVAETIADMIVNCGTGTNNRHIKAIQKILGVEQDGIVGTNTLRAINKTNSTKLYNKIYHYREWYYHRIGVGNQRKFLKGWINRIIKLKKLHQNEKYLIS